MPNEIILIKPKKLEIILPEHDRRSEGCPLCNKIENPQEGDFFEFCQEHYDEIISEANEIKNT